MILDTGMEKPDTLPLLSVTKKLLVSRQPRRDVRLLPIRPSLLITGAEALSHFEPKVFILHPGDKTRGGVGMSVTDYCL